MCSVYNYMEEKEIIALLTDLLVGVEANRRFDVVPLPQAGSNRRYFRFSDGQRSYIGTYSPDPSEGECFVGLATRLSTSCDFVPRVYAVSGDSRFYIQEDLGSESLFSKIGSDECAGLVKETLTRLTSLQKADGSLWEESCLSRPFNKRQIMWDLNYFKYEFLKPQEVAFDEDRLEDDFERLASRLIGISEEFMGFMIRDCQSRNVMVTEKGPVFIDFQGGRKGPALYDAVSLLWQARAGFSDRFRIEMLNHYADVYCEGDIVKKEKMLSVLDDLVLFRTLQVLGAYGFRGLVQRKPHFILSIPGAISNLKKLLEKGALDEYPELRGCSESLLKLDSKLPTQTNDGLTVEIYSFSYKKGYPEDFSGNGGGFMFDCRALHNPGRYQEYRHLTGRDKAVIDFLEARGEAEPFLRNAWALIDPSVERYISRGFTHIQIGFGCTGGQHRSVYSAERTAGHVREVFPEVTVRLRHIEHPES